MEGKINVLVLGNSGAGKSTLIEALSGKETDVGIGEGQTPYIKIYESNIWPITFIDTKGFEYNLLKQIRTTRQILKFTEEQKRQFALDEKTNGVNATSDAGIDVVWYCIEGTSKRVFLDNIRMMNNTVSRWRDVPVFAVITKSYSELEDEENIRAVSDAFKRLKKPINIKNIIPVVAKPYAVRADSVVEQKGLEELCTATINISPEAKQIKDSNRVQMLLDQKRFTSQALVFGASAAAAGIGFAPIGIADSKLLIPLETGMTAAIFRTFGIDNPGLVKEVIGSAAISMAAKSIVGAINVGPNIPVMAVNAAVAGTIVTVLGEAVTFIAERIYTGKLDTDKANEVIDTVRDKIGSNPVLGKAVEYIEKNPEQLTKLNKVNAGEFIKDLLSYILPKGIGDGK